MNCLEYALTFWEKNPDYRIHYNSNHAINLPNGTFCDGFLPIELFGYNYCIKAFTLSEKAKELLKSYFYEDKPIS